MTLNVKYTWFSLAIMLLVLLLLIEVIIIFATDTDAIVTAQPAYAVTLFVVGLASLLTLIILLSRSRKISKQTPSTSQLAVTQED